MRARWMLLAAVLGSGCVVVDNPDVCDLEAGDPCRGDRQRCENFRCVPEDAGATARDSSADHVVDGGADGPALDRGMDGGTRFDAAADVVMVPDAPGSCTSHGDCSPLQPYCLAGICRGCKTDQDCSSNAAGGRCEEVSQRCVPCTKSAHCNEPSRPVCGEDHRCARCQTDEQCVQRQDGHPGICLDHEDGRCADTSETWFLKSKLGCSAAAPGDGSAANPFCSSQKAIDALTPAKRVVRVLGTATLPLDGFAYARSDLAQPVTIVGDGTAKILAVGVEALRVSAGELYVRGLHLTSQAGTAVVAEAPATLHLNRCVISGSGAGGLYVNAAGFDVINTVIADNRSAPPPAPKSFGGAYLLGINGKPQRFAYNTIVGNRGFGLFCEQPQYKIRGLLLFGNGVNVEGCAVPLQASFDGNAQSPGDPMFDPARMHHLTAGSPCVDAGDPAATMDLPIEDLDGKRRPAAMTKLDCGADEFQP